MIKRQNILILVNICMLLCLIGVFSINKVTKYYDDLSKHELTIGQIYKKRTIEQWESRYEKILKSIEKLHPQKAIVPVERFCNSVPANQPLNILSAVKEKAILKVIELALLHGNYRKADTYYSKLISLFPRNIIHLYNYADFLFEQADYKEAFKIANSLWELDPTNIKHASILIEILDKLDRKDELISVYEKFLKNNYLYTDYTRVFFAGAEEEFNDIRALPIFSIIVDEKYHTYNVIINNRNILPDRIGKLRIDPVSRTTFFEIAYIIFRNEKGEEFVKFDNFEEWFLTGVELISENSFKNIWPQRSIVKDDLDIPKGDIFSIELKLKFGFQQFTGDIELIVNEAYEAQK